MNTKILKLSKNPTLYITAGLTILTFAFMTVLAHAQVQPLISTVIHNVSHATTTSAQIGTVVHDKVILASVTVGSSTPTGTVDFNLYPNTTCSGTPATQSAVALSSGVAESGTTTVPNTGLSYKAHYNGQGDVYSTIDADCEPLVAVASAPTISTTLSSTTVMVGASVHDSAIIGSATANATGTVAYNVYTNNVCNAGSVSAGSKTVTNGVVPDSNSIQFNTVGTFYWQAVYSGDQHNASATSSCQSEILNVLATTTGTGSISGTVYNDLAKNLMKDVGDPGLSGWTINLYKGVGWWGPWHLPPIMTVVSDANGNYSFNNLADGTYSIEEINQTGWTQLTGDYKSVVLSGSAHLTGYDFGDASSTPKRGNGHGFFKHFKKWHKFWNHFQKHGNGKGNDDNNEDD